MIILALINDIDFSLLKETKRAKVISNHDQIIHILNIFTGKTEWQKELQYPIDITNMQNHMAGDTMLFQTAKGRLSAFNLHNGKQLWEFYTEKKNTPLMKYTINDEKSIFNFK